jgi:flagellar protein FliS
MSAYPRSNLAAYQSVAAHGGVAAADPHRLVLMLLDGAIERIAGARGALGSGALDAKSRLLHRAVAIVNELRGSLNMEQGGDLASNLGDLYDYCGRMLIKANLENRPEPLEEVAKLLREIRGAWIQIAPRHGSP